MYKAGKIVLVSFPFTDLTSAKVRPAVIVSNKPMGDDVVMAFISTNIKKKSRFEIFLKTSRENGLKSDSVIIISKLATLEKKTILGEIGELSNSNILEVRKKLKELFF